MEAPKAIDPKICKILSLKNYLHINERTTTPCHRLVNSPKSLVGLTDAIKEQPTEFAWLEPLFYDVENQDKKSAFDLISESINKLDELYKTRDEIAIPSDQLTILKTYIQCYTTICTNIRSVTMHRLHMDKSITLETLDKVLLKCCKSYYDRTDFNKLCCKYEKDPKQHAFYCPNCNAPLIH